MTFREDGTASPRGLLGIPANVFRFGMVGVTVAVVFAALNAFFAKVCGLGPQISFLAAYPPALCLHFLLNKIWTFGDRARTSHHQVGEYLYSVLVTFLIQWPAFEILHGMLGLRGWIAALGANLLQMTASYLLLRTRVFAAREHAAGENPWHRISVLLAVVGGLALIYWTCMAGWNAPSLHRTEQDYYNLLVRGFRKGSLAMDMRVPDALKKSPNPWDPAMRPPGVAAHDVSYYNGKYYLYFGVVPAVLFFWPFRALTGYDLPFTIATTCYLCGGFLVAAWLWLRILRDRFTSAGPALRICGVLVLGLAGGQLGLARRNSIWEMPISAGTFYMACLSAAVYLAILGRRRLLSLAAAGLCLGLAIGCRPTLAAAGPALAFVVLWAAWEGRQGRPFLRSLAAPLAASAAPFTAVFGSLLEYNYLRFGKFTEFGLNYQLTGNYEAKAKHFLLRFLPYNIQVYFIKPPQWGRYFPFFHPFSWIQQPKGYYGTEFVYGAFVVCPVLWGIAAGFVLAWRRRASAEGAVTGFFLLAAAGISGMLCCFNTAASRYEADFLPMCLWLALLGWAWLSSSPGVRTAGAWAVSVLSAITLILAFAQSIAVHGIFQAQDPAAYATLSRFFDVPAAMIEKARGERLGAVEMDVVFASPPPGTLEPLLISGVEYESDYFFVYYESASVVRIGYTSAGDSPVYSHIISVVPGRAYHLRFEGGALYPPAGHPAYSSWSERQVKAAKSWIRISVDGQIVLGEPRYYHEGTPGFLELGRDERSGAFGRRFSGKISGFRREPLVAVPTDAYAGGDIELDLDLPSAVVPQSQPLVVAGQPGSAELVGYRTLDEGHFVLSYEKWGAGLWESDPIAVPASRTAHFRIRLGSLLPKAAWTEARHINDRLVIWMDGLPVWWREIYGGIGDNPDVDILANAVGSSAMRQAFQGNLVAARKRPIPYPGPGAFEELQVDLIGRGTGVEPLAVTGAPGKADELAIEWLPGGRARFILDHWAYPAIRSQQFDWDSSHVHHIAVRLPSFAALGTSPSGPQSGPVSAEVDGKPVWSAEARFYPAAADSFVFGENSVGSSVAVQSLSCVLCDLQKIRKK